MSVFFGLLRCYLLNNIVCVNFYWKQLYDINFVNDSICTLHCIQISCENSSIHWLQLITNPFSSSTRTLFFYFINQSVVVINTLPHSISIHFPLLSCQSNTIIITLPIIQKKPGLVQTLPQWQIIIGNALLILIPLLLLIHRNLSKRQLNVNVSLYAVAYFSLPSLNDLSLSV